MGEPGKSSTHADDAQASTFEVSSAANGAIEQEGPDDLADSSSQFADVARHAEFARTALAGSLSQLAGAAAPAATAARCFGEAMVAAGVSGIEHVTSALRSDSCRLSTTMTTTPDQCPPNGQ